MIYTLEVDSVVLEFKSKIVLQDVYLKSETGKVTGLLGRNGTGKTCLMKIIYGELTPNYKSIRINGKSFESNFRGPDLMRYLPQHRFIPNSLKINTIFKDYRLDFSDFINEFPEFNAIYETRFGHLSSGEQRIVEIYSLIASETKFCLLDEPFSQIMPRHVDTIKNLIIREKNNKGVLLTDHLYQHILDICDTLYVINNGKTYLTKSQHDIEALGYAKIGG